MSDAVPRMLQSTRAAGAAQYPRRMEAAPARRFDQPAPGELGARTRARSRLRELALFLAVLAAAVVFARAHWSRNDVHPPAALERLIAFDAETPYQTRVLVPLLVRGFQASGLAERLDVTPLEFALALDALAVALLFYALRALVARFVPGAWAPSAWAAVGLVALPFLYVLPREWPYWYPWDVPAVLFTTLGVLWIRDQRWAAYYWMLPFATLNRETTAFLIAVFALTQAARMPRAAFVAHLAAQAAIWVVLKKLLAMTFAKNPGVGAFYAKALEENWALRGSLDSWLTVALTWGGLWIPLLLLFPRVRDPFVRRAVYVVPLFVAVCYAMAQFDEVRVYGEMLPLVLLGVACGATAWRAERADGARGATAPSAP